MDCIIRGGTCVYCGWEWSGDPAVHRNCPALKNLVEVFDLKTGETSYRPIKPQLNPRTDGKCQHC
jgi:hypothetical protein